MEKRYIEAFERAKHLSDIIAMLTRLSFLVLLTTFVAALTLALRGEPSRGHCISERVLHL